MRSVSAFTTKIYARPYPLQERIEETLHLIKATIKKENLVKITFDGIITVALIVLVSYAAARFNEQRIAASYINEAYNSVINPYH